MVTIIKQGQLPEERVHRHTCPNCKTVYEFTEAEAKRQSDWRDGSWLEINCPYCKKRNIISIDKTKSSWDRW